MSYTRDDIKDFLWSYRVFRSIAQDKRDKYMSQYESATKTTTAVTGMPRGGGSDRHALLSGMIDSKDDLSGWDAVVEKWRGRVVGFIESSTLDLFHKNILFYRYVCMYEWSKVKEKMDGLYGEVLIRQLYREHNKALDELVGWAYASSVAKEILHGYFRNE